MSAFRHRDGLERRYDGPILPADPALAALPTGPGRARLFQRLAAEQRQDVARRRVRVMAARVLEDEGLRTSAHRLSFYRDQGAAWQSL
ncbi:conserved hypothetical protein [Candidatus Terasakiella magnetica]|nr:conserved hypothetical protein [Candidatus Terasakiella magnetica]